MHSYKLKHPRKLTPREVGFLERALRESAPPGLDGYLARIPDLRVTGRCQCNRRRDGQWSLMLDDPARKPDGVASDPVGCIAEFYGRTAEEPVHIWVTGNLRSRRILEIEVGENRTGIPPVIIEVD